MSVISVISLYLKGFHMTVQSRCICECQAIVMLIVIGKMAYVKDFRSRMTVVTLMTMDYGCCS